MHTAAVDLFRARDSADSYAIRLAADDPESWRAETGFGQNYQRVWTVDIESTELPDFAHMDWDAVLERVVEAFSLSDPVITSFQWPQQESAKR